MSAFKRPALAKPITLLKDLPFSFKLDLSESHDTEKTFNVWSYSCWVPYSARPRILRELGDLLG